ncbi:MAG: 2-C-methyl-D-erythritol 4-phosphate cytidylyltransferase [Planctomycetaceae bacterium]|jgi:2-C-methyl-D-erythritol 4-phosphate cytidylyltransferase|nr:2-C-methyl-D-erythritol 4-phosphate cytidylyltransferase [Planctomycetaceae bacterium]
MPDSEGTTFAVIIAAAGKGTRFNEHRQGGQPVKKAFAHLDGKPLWLHSAEKFYAREDVVQIIVAVAPEDAEWFRQYYMNEINSMLLALATGGAERGDTVKSALSAVSPRAGYIAVHDAARPCITGGDIEAVFREAEKTGAALLASPVYGTLKRVEDGVVEKTVDRCGVWEAQTPQVFRRDILEEAYKSGHHLLATDDSQLVEMLGGRVSIVPGNRLNIKITDRHDLMLARWIISNQFNPS